MNSRRDAILRRLWPLILVLCASNLVLGGISYHSLHKFSAAFEELYTQSVPAMNSLRLLTRDVAAVHRNMLRSQRVTDAGEHARFLDLMKKALADSERGEAYVLDPDGDGKPWVNMEVCNLVRKQGRAYRQAAAAYLAIADVKPRSELIEFSDQQLRPAYDDYLEAIDEVAASLEKKSNVLGTSNREGVQHFEKIILGVGGWPLAFTAVAVVVLSFVVLIMTVWLALLSE